MKKAFLVSLMLVGIISFPLLSSFVFANTIVLTEADNENTFEISKGDTLVVELLTQFEAGYSWRLGPYHNLVLVNDFFSFPRKDLGGASLQRFTLRADAVGPNTLYLEYSNHLGDRAKTFRVTIRVRP